MRVTYAMFLAQEKPNLRISRAYHPRMDKESEAKKFNEIKPDGY
jgi:hypothetical protein